MRDKEPKSMDPDNDLPKARVRPSHLAWLIWLIPVGAVAFCGWLLYRDFVSKGPTIHIRFSNADGLDPGNTPIEYRGAKVGKVTAVQLTKDCQAVEVTAELKRSAGELARKNSLFWIVKPEVKIGSVRALRTIVSGNYITVQPGTGSKADHFIGEEQPPAATNPQAGLHVTLLAPDLGSLQSQSPIIYKGVQVGEILSYRLAEDAQNIVVHARILPPYAPLVRRNTKFWNAGGIHVDVSLLHGAEISAVSPQAIVAGAVEFATPSQPGEPALDGMAFRLYEKPEEPWKNWAPVIHLGAPPETESTNRIPHLSAK